MIRRLFSPLFALALLIGSAAGSYANGPRIDPYSIPAPPTIDRLPVIPPPPPLPPLPPLPVNPNQPYAPVQPVVVVPPLPIQPAPVQPIVVVPPLPIQPAPVPVAVSPVAFDFEVSPAVLEKSADGAIVKFQTSVKVDNAKGRNVVFVALLTDKSGKVLVDESGNPLTIPYKFTPTADQSEQVIDFTLPKAELAKIYGEKAKEFYLETVVLDMTEVKDPKDPAELAKAKTLGTGPAIFTVVIPTEGEKVTNLPLSPTDVLKY
ncbi:MAG: hypothetical protein K8T89_17420 [Planctomycetes bacterium]|nr:hypothetical protein [Planctomycetota bacterium]